MAGACFGDWGEVPFLFFCNWCREWILGFVAEFSLMLYLCNKMQGEFIQSMGFPEFGGLESDFSPNGVLFELIV